MNARDCLTKAFTEMCQSREAIRENKAVRALFTQLVMTLTNPDPEAPQCESWDDVRELARQLVVLFLPDELRPVEQDMVNVFQAVVAAARKHNPVYVPPTKI